MDDSKAAGEIVAHPSFCLARIHPFYYDWLSKILVLETLGTGLCLIGESSSTLTLSLVPETATRLMPESLWSTVTSSEWWSSKTGWQQNEPAKGFKLMESLSIFSSPLSWHKKSDPWSPESVSLPISPEGEDVDDVGRAAAAVAAVASEAENSISSRFCWGVQVWAALNLLKRSLCNLMNEDVVKWKTRFLSLYNFKYLIQIHFQLKKQPIVVLSWHISCFRSNSLSGQLSCVKILKELTKIRPRRRESDFNTNILLL